jgi:long-subunit acyl-CoA synthetase (AMP-forming)
MAEHGAIDPGCLVFVAVGGARVAPVLLQRAVAAGIPAYEGYGLTEFASVATLNLPGASRPGSIGKPLPGVSLSIAADGEICLSRTALDQAPIHSGDYGSIDADGYVYIEGRKSNRIVLSNGRNVAPEWVEAELDASPAIDRSFVFSQADDHLAALVSSTDTDARIDAEIERVNQQLPVYAQVREWHRLERPFSREQQTLTANGRLRRARIRELLPQLVFTPSVLRGQPGQDHPVTLQERNPC